MRVDPTRSADDPLRGMVYSRVPEHVTAGSGLPLIGPSPFGAVSITMLP
jgi:hypothetical protein